jgi:hypothetical protein
MRAGVLLILLPTLWACSGLPVVREVTSDERPELYAACQIRFPQGNWTVVHAIQVQLPGGGQSVLLGVSASTPSEDRLESVLLSPEGIVLIEASVQAHEIKVVRALPPFDQDAFAQGLFSDVRFLFSPPTGDPTRVGRTADGEIICRYQQGGRTEDLLPSPSGGWTRREYSGNKLRRQVISDGPDEDGFARTQDLSVRGLGAYQMFFTRVTESED